MLGYNPYVIGRWETKAQIKMDFEKVLPMGIS